ncbi:MAG: hypothetical protein ACJAWA_000460 [Nonlabens sp.]|jgi:hypothetical protein
MILKEDTSRDKKQNHRTQKMPDSLKNQAPKLTNQKNKIFFLL